MGSLFGNDWKVMIMMADTCTPPKHLVIHVGLRSSHATLVCDEFNGQECAIYELSFYIIHLETMIIISIVISLFFIGCILFYFNYYFKFISLLPVLLFYFLKKLT